MYYRSKAPSVSLVSSMFRLLASTTATRHKVTLRTTRLSLTLLYLSGIAFLTGMIFADFVVGASALSA